MYESINAVRGVRALRAQGVALQRRLHGLLVKAAIERRAAEALEEDAMDGA